MSTSELVLQEMAQLPTEVQADVLQYVKSLRMAMELSPNSAQWNEVVAQDIEASKAELDAGGGIPHKAVMSRIEKRFGL